ncbi:MAG TPA: hypothetical protein VF533_21745 [Solirubrobacteraceae bacterium]|jgi:hypothetical protein
MLAAFSPSPVPFIGLMALGFLVGAIGHVYKSKTTVAAGIGLIFLATLLLPLGIYVGGR